MVGGGIVGLCCAWRAARRGAEVAVVDCGEPGGATTRVAAGMLAPVGELTFGEPELLRLTLEAASAYPAFVEELEEATGVSTGYRRLGALHVALDRDEAEQLRRVHELQGSLDLEAEWLPSRRCRDLEPGLTPSFHGGVWAPGEAAVDPRRLTAALLAGLDSTGVEVLTGSAVTEGVFDGTRLAGVRTGSGEELRAASVVLAAGAWSGEASWLPPEARPPVRPVKGQLLELAPLGGRPPCERILASERVYLVPREDGRLIVGATVEERGFETAVTAGGVHELLREAYRLLPEVSEMELLDSLAGLRPGTPDNLPRVGPGEIDGLVLATGHYRNGILLAPHTAEAVADVLAGDSAADLAARSPFVAHTATNSERTLGAGR